MTSGFVRTQLDSGQGSCLVEAGDITARLELGILRVILHFRPGEKSDCFVLEIL